MKLVTSGVSPDIYIVGRQSAEAFDQAFNAAFGTTSRAVFDSETENDAFVDALRRLPVAQVFSFARADFPQKIIIYSTPRSDIGTALVRFVMFLDTTVLIDVGKDVADNRALRIDADGSVQTGWMNEDSDIADDPAPVFLPLDLS